MSVHRHVVIVVDDDINVRRLFQDALVAAGIRAHVTANAEEAIRLASAYRDSCLLLADVRMPRMDGWDLERELRKVAPGLPVVLVSADRLLSIRGSVRDKPVAPDDIAALVRTSCAHAERPNRQPDESAPPRPDR
ncbi:MAG TPA: response regulator [Candidatus Limnocylindria bacterium]